MLTQKIEEALVHKYIAKITLTANTGPVYGVFTGKIKVMDHVEENNDVRTSYKYYFKEIDLERYLENKDVYRAMKSVLVIMQNQLTDVQESISVGFSNTR
mgnify:CR=1 FL=1